MKETYRTVVDVKESGKWRDKMLDNVGTVESDKTAAEVGKVKESIKTVDSGESD